MTPLGSSEYPTAEVGSLGFASFLFLSFMAKVKVKLGVCYGAAAGGRVACWHVDCGLAMETSLSFRFASFRVFL